MKEIKKLYNQFLLSDGVSTDTRGEVHNKIFFALSGDNHNGNSYTEEAIKKGARFCVIDDSTYAPISDNYILVPDALNELQELARYHRKQSNAIVLAITGSNGKTTTKELISSVLSNYTEIISTKGNFNNHIGVPLTLLTIKPTTKIAVIEMGANHIGEIHRLCEIAKPDIGIITNIGKAHLEGFGSFEGVIEAKNELYNYLKKTSGHAIVNSNDELLIKLSHNIRQTTYGLNNAVVEGEMLNTKPFLQINWGYNENIHRCNSKMFGNYNFNNILAAIATGLYFNVPEQIINDSIENYIPQNNRSQKLQTESNRIIMDAYNANPYSMVEAITSFTECGFDNPWLLLGDMFELGEYSQGEHKAIVEMLIDKGTKNVILIGEAFCNITDHNYISFVTTDQALAHIQKNKITNSDILIKGSRGMKLEKLLIAL